jgi:hypothetical protein
MSWLDECDGTVFYGFWFFFVLGIPFDFAKKYDAMADPRYVGLALVGCALAGIIIWRILKKERFSPIRNVVVALQGLIFFPSLFFILTMVPFLLLMLPSTLLGFSSAERYMEALFSVGLTLGPLIGLFLGGCFVGLRIRRLVPFWGVLAAGWFCFLLTKHMGGTNVLAEDPGISGGMGMVVALAASIFGSHLGRRYAMETAHQPADGGNKKALTEE